MLIVTCKQYLDRIISDIISCEPHVTIITLTGYHGLFGWNYKLPDANKCRTY